MLTRCAPSQGGCHSPVVLRRGCHSPRRARRATAGGVTGCGSAEVSLARGRLRGVTRAGSAGRRPRAAARREPRLGFSIRASCAVDRSAWRRPPRGRPGYAGRGRCPSGSTVAAGRWCSRWCRAATGYADRRSTPAGRSVDPQLGVLGHLGALVPGQRAAQLLRQRCDRAGDRVTDRLGAVAGERGTVLHPRAIVLPSAGGEGAS